MSGLEVEDVVWSLGMAERRRVWRDREGCLWRWCNDVICRCWERQEVGGWLRTERQLTLSDYAPFTAADDEIICRNLIRAATDGHSESDLDMREA